MRVNFDSIPYPLNYSLFLTKLEKIKILKFMLNLKILCYDTDKSNHSS